MPGPALPRLRLIRLAGAIWLAMGLVLVAVALYWYRDAPDALLLGALVGLIFGPLLNRLKVADLAAGNVRRIQALMPGRARLPLVEVQSRRNYVIIALMIVMGATLRRSPVPKTYVAPVYLVMGIALIMASRVYFGVRSGSADPD